MTVGFFGGKFLPLHLGHMYAILEASTQVDKLYVVLSSSKEEDKRLCVEDGIKYIPMEVRLSWIGEAINNLENVEAIMIEDYNWQAGSLKIVEAIPEKITHVFSSEKAYSKYFDMYYPWAKHVIIDNSRNTVNIRAMHIRSNIYQYWDMLPNVVKGFFVKRVAVVGTESVGKSTLVKKLAKFYNTNFVHEIGRDYCEKYSNKLTIDMFDKIVIEHYMLTEKLCETSNKVLFVDSEAITSAYYLKMYFNAKSRFIESIIEKQHFDFWLYLEPDVKWVADGYRFLGDDKVRQENNKFLMGLMMYYNEDIGNHQIISGNYPERFKKARECVNSLISSN